MAILYAKNVTGNWNAATSWSAVSSVSIDDAGVPDATTDCVFDATFTGSITLTASTTVNSVVCNALAAGTLTHNASVTLTIDGQDGSGNSLLMVAGMTYTLGSATTSAITFTGAGTNKITTGGRTLGNIVFNNAGDTFQLQDGLTTSGSITNTAGTFDPNSQTVTMTGATPTITPAAALSFYNLTRTGNAVKTDTLILAGTITVTNALTLTGNSGINRLLVYSTILGTARTITLGVAATFKTNSSNFDMCDITMTGGAANELDCSTVTGGSGDCGGNTGITFTTADDWYWYAAGAVNPDDFSDYQYWYTDTAGGGSQMASTRTVLPQDTCHFDSSSVNGTVRIDQDLPRIPAIDFTGVDAMTFDLNNLSQDCFGSLTFGDNVTYTTAYTKNIGLYGRGSYNMDTASKSLTLSVSIYSFGGTYTLQDDLTCTYGVSLQNGTFDANDYDLSFSNGGFSSVSLATRSLYMGNGTWTWTGQLWRNGSSGWTTFDAEGSTIVGAGGAVITTDGKPMNNITFLTSASSSTINDTSTFATFTINAPKTVKFTAGTKTTIRKLIANGKLNSKITIKSSADLSRALLILKSKSKVKRCIFKDIWVLGLMPLEAIQSSNLGGNQKIKFYTSRNRILGFFEEVGGAPVTTKKRTYAYCY